MRLAGAQINLVVGDLAGNESKIGEAMEWAESKGADLLLLPELAITGYPPEDLLLRPSFIDDNLAALQRLAVKSATTTTVVGFVDRASGAVRGAADAVSRPIANAAAVLRGGEIAGIYHKVLLPNYGVFDEDRYFSAGREPARTWRIGERTLGVSICEDIWLADGPPTQQAAAGAQLLVNINASPYHRGKALEREEMIRARAVASGCPVFYLNLVGGQDELVFDGCSMVFASDGTLIHRSPQFEEDRFVVEMPGSAQVSRLLGEEEEVYRALVTGLRDYVDKNRFEHVVIGLSGGIDSALTAAVAADALGAERVWGISLPSRFSSEGSIVDAKDLAHRLGIRYDLIPIDGIFQTYVGTLAEAFAGTESGVAEENLQARIRGALLMALSNKFGGMVIATGNKSETAVGYSTIYGDMVGGYSVLKDVLKTWVYRLARWRNDQSEVIPLSSLSKPPSAELRPNQRDSDSLPEYDVLDPILSMYVERDMSADDIVAAGAQPGLVARVVALVDRNEYKRRQAAPGVKITTKAFGRDRRLPITNRYR